MRLIYPVLDGQIRISQGFGPSQIDYSRWGLKGHNGVDFFGKAGDPILSVADGTVTWVGFEKDGYGHFIMIDIGDYVDIYAHLLEAPKLKKCAKVKQGDQIGLMGSTGNSTGVHLHYGKRPKEYNKNDGWLGYIDPLPLLSFEMDGLTPPIPVIEPESISVADAKAVRVITDTANIRQHPGASGALMYAAQKGDVFQVRGEQVLAGGLTWVPVFVPAWVATHDGTDQMLECA